MTADSTRDTRGYDLFKLTVTLFLIALILLLTLANDDQAAVGELPSGAVAALAFGRVQTSPTGLVSVAGSGPALVRVRLLVDGQEAGESTAAEDGSWSWQSPLEAGEHQLQAQVLDASGGVESETEPVTVSVAPASLTIAVATGARAGQDAEIGGTGQPAGAEVEVLVDRSVVGSAVVGQDGRWVLSVAAPEAGAHELTARLRDAAGSLLVESPPETWDVAVAGPEGAAGAETGGAVADIRIGEPEVSASDQTVTLSGVSAPAARIVILVDGEEADESAEADADGAWTVTLGTTPGTHDVVAMAISEDGSEVGESQPVTFELLVMATEPPAAGVGATGAPTSAAVSSATSTQAEPVLTATMLSAPPPATPLPMASPSAAVGAPTAVPAPTAPSGTGAAGGGEAYIVKAGDWLSSIALSFYGDMSEWPRILDGTNAKAKTDPSFAVIADPDSIEIGWKLWIPLP